MACSIQNYVEDGLKSKAAGKVVAEGLTATGIPAALKNDTSEVGIKPEPEFPFKAGGTKAVYDSEAARLIPRII